MRLIVCRAVTVWGTVKGTARALETISDCRQKTPLSAQWQGQQDGDRCTAEWVKTCGSQWRGVGACGSGVPSLCQRFQLSPSTRATIYEHDLPTLQLPYSARSPTSRTPQLHQTTPTSTPLTLWPAAGTLSRQDKPFDRACKTTNVIRCVFLDGSTCTHSRSQTGPLCSHSGGQWLFLRTSSKVTHKKIQYSKCTGSPAYQYIIQKGDRWRAIRRWKAIEFSVSPYLHMHQSAAVDNWIKKETWWRSSSKKLKLPAIWCREPLIAFFGSKNYLWHLHSSASCLHFN